MIRYVTIILKGLCGRILAVKKYIYSQKNAVFTHPLNFVPPDISLTPLSPLTVSEITVFLHGFGAL